MKKNLFLNVSGTLSRFSRRQKLILYAAVAALALAFVDRLILRTATGKLAGLDQQIKAQESQIKKDLRIVALTKAINDARADFSSYLVNFKSASEEVTAIQKEIKDYADRLKFSVFDMRAPKELAREKGASPVRIKAYIVEISCEGTMEQITEFMFAIETAKRLLTVDQYALIPKSKDSNLVKANLKIRYEFVQ